MPKEINFKVKNWKELEEVSRKIIYENKETIVVPMGYHGFNRTKVILDADDEIKQDLKYHDEHKWSKTGTILLIGSGS